MCPEHRFSNFCSLKLLSFVPGSFCPVTDKHIWLSAGRVVVVRSASGLRSSRQAGSQRAKHEPALPRVRGAQLAPPLQPRGLRRRQRARVPPQQQQSSAQRMRWLRRQNSRKVPPTRARPILAPRVFEVRVLRASARGHGQELLLQRRHDTVQKRLHQVSPLIFCSTLFVKNLIGFDRFPDA